VAPEGCTYPAGVHGPWTDLPLRWARDPQRPELWVEAPRVFFMHIPKAAGTSFGQMLARLVPLEASHGPELIIGAEAGLWRPETGFPGSLQLCQGHIPLAEGTELVGKCHVLTILRDPVSRAISEYRFRRSLPMRSRDVGRARGRAMAHRFELREFFQRQATHGDAYRPNGQTQYLAGRLASTTRPELVEPAVEALRALTFVGIHENLESSLEVFAATFGLPGAARSWMPLTNVGPAIDEGVPDDVHHLVREQNALDLVVYEAARAELAARHARLVGAGGGAGTPPVHVNAPIPQDGVVWTAAAGTLWGPGLHSPEPTDARGSHVWTGAAPEGALLFTGDAHDAGVLEVVVEAHAAIDEGCWSSFEVRLGDSAPLRIQHHERDGALIYRAELPVEPGGGRHALRLLGEARSAFERGGGEDDPRELGVALRRVQLRPSAEPPRTESR